MSGWEETKKINNFKKTKKKLCHKCKHKEPPYILCTVCDGEVMFEEVE